jgi:molybdopterin/thiamine biosynthesis adenylyltransferase
MTMNDEQLLRYSRQIMLPDVDVAGQEKLLAARVLIVGLGGLGAPAALYLAASGVGHLVLVDDDVVELSNLQRQIIHDHTSIDLHKVESARSSILRLNPDIEVTPLDHRLERNELIDQVRLADVIIDATDNFRTRFQLNEVCVAERTPLVSGAAIRTEGQVSVFLPRTDSPCYRCLYHEAEDVQESCSETGVLAPLVGIIGSILAMEAVKVVTGLGETLCGRVLLLDAKTMDWRTIKLRKDPACPVCGTKQGNP